MFIRIFYEWLLESGNGLYDCTCTGILTFPKFAVEKIKYEERDSKLD